MRLILVVALVVCAACTNGTTTTMPTTTPSTGPSPLPVVPNVVGLTMTDAKQKLRAVGLTTYVKEKTFSKKPPGTIIEQSPKARSEANPGTEIDVVVVVPSPVPHIAGLSVRAAKRKLRHVFLHPVIRDKTSTLPKNTVIAQGIAPGKTVPGGTNVRVVVVTPHVCGYPLNPYCFSVTSGGSLIYSPPADLCTYLSCIPSFWSSTSGYVIQCADGEFSHSGGVSGSC